ncbi:MAG: hypothetical protein RLZZ08_1330 [Pseudomonadota bacterium]|jgi:phosphohistidine phosphatase
MKLLGLLRHAKSDWDDLALRDFDRGLNQRGRTGAALMGHHIVDHGVRWDMALASPAERVKTTLEASRLTMPITWDQRAYLADSDSLLMLLRALPRDADSVLLAAHNPGLHDLLLTLADPKDAHGTGNDALFEAAAEKFPTAAFAVLKLDIADWADCAPGCGRLVHFARPRDLDPALGPIAYG